MMVEQPAFHRAELDLHSSAHPSQEGGFAAVGAIHESFTRVQ